jgi:hypothetical protein
MKVRNILAIIAISLFLMACNRAITLEQAANGGYKRCRNLK